MRRAGVLVTTGVTALALLTGCSADATPASQAAAGTGGTSPSAAAEAKQPQAVITVTPADSARRVRPTSTVTVTAAKGKLTEVTVTDQKTRTLRGALAADATSWASKGRLRYGSRYRVDAVAVDSAGRSTTTSTYFATLRPKALLTTSISPLTGATVGVGMPIVVRFSAPVTDRAAVQRGLTVETSKAVEGAWSWVSDSEVHYRPEQFWPAYTRISLGVRLLDVPAGSGVYGGENRTVAYQTGSSMVTVVNVRRHRATIYRNGKVARVVPVSTGKDGFLTRGGTKVVLEKHKLKIMDAATIGISKSDPEYYRLEVPYAMRVTWSGEFVHAAPWSVASQGRDNVSHGCVGMSTKNAIWLYNQSKLGDVVKVVGSPRRLEPGNGYTDWNVPWSTWLEGSAQ